MECALVHHSAANLAVPAQPVQTALRPRLLEHDADGGGEADGVVRRVGRQEEHFPFADGQVAEDGGAVGGVFVNDFEEHAAAVLVEPFRGWVDVVVCAGVRGAEDLFEGALRVSRRGESEYVGFSGVICRKGDGEGQGQRQRGERAMSRDKEGWRYKP